MQGGGGGRKREGKRLKGNKEKTQRKKKKELEILSSLFLSFFGCTKWHLVPNPARLVLEAESCPLGHQASPNSTFLSSLFH